MIKLRYGNDFVFVWSIKRHDVPVDLNTAIEKTLKLIYRGGVKLIPFTVSDTNKIRIEFTPLILDMTGGYSLEFSFILPDINLQDAGQLCTLDLELFLLVEKTSNADETEQMQFSSDIGFGLIGDSSFTSWLKIPGNTGKTWDDYIAYLREPMTLAIEEGEQTAAEWTIAENARKAAELIRIENEEVRVEAEVLRNAAMLSNLIRLEIDEENNLFFETPEDYDGMEFELENGNLIALI